MNSLLTQWKLSATQLAKIALAGVALSFSVGAFADWFTDERYRRYKQYYEHSFPADKHVLTGCSGDGSNCKRLPGSVVSHTWYHYKWGTREDGTLGNAQEYRQFFHKGTEQKCTQGNCKLAYRNVRFSYNPYSQLTYGSEVGTYMKNFIKARLNPELISVELVWPTTQTINKGFKAQPVAYVWRRTGGGYVNNFYFFDFKDEEGYYIYKYKLFLGKDYYPNYSSWMANKAMGKPITTYLVTKIK